MWSPNRRKKEEEGLPVCRESLFPPPFHFIVHPSSALLFSPLIRSGGGRQWIFFPTQMGDFVGGRKGGKHSHRMTKGREEAQPRRCRLLPAILTHTKGGERFCTWMEREETRLSLPSVVFPSSRLVFQGPAAPAPPVPPVPPTDTLPACLQGVSVIRTEVSERPSASAAAPTLLLFFFAQSNFSSPLLRNSPGRRKKGEKEKESHQCCRCVAFRGGGCA